MRLTRLIGKFIVKASEFWVFLTLTFIDIVLFFLKQNYKYELILPSGLLDKTFYIIDHIGEVGLNIFLTVLFMVLTISLILAAVYSISKYIHSEGSSEHIFKVITKFVLIFAVFFSDIIW
ncbi:hypothetical protein R2R35_19760 [Anaerocolumna sp. AGMB13020]|uniref:hypothetical protein n=1 Tax=Anaerocolumna sp. AGMB13020 TaxID=3081750 RepID=UPI002953E1C2|nr:hypothetical protein [Anaerocolumna sp. AGMB13020]WOO36009.1 hypothetical protein R2R35_19760 [Anaerocolumna sp. AGMB13020]